MPAVVRNIVRNKGGIAETWPNYYREYQETYERQRISPVASFVIRSERKPVALTVQQIVSALRDGGMPVSAIADAMRVERKTVYSWLEGVEVRDAHAQRAALVHSLLAGIPGIDVRNVYRFWNTPIAGQTLRDLICAPIIDARSVRSVLDTVRPTAQRARDSERKMLRNGAGNPVLDEIPTTESTR